MFAVNRRTVIQRCLVSTAVYLTSWLLGIFLALKYLPESVIEQIDIHPQAQNAWLYISHNLELELLFLLGALTLGVGTILLLIGNGCVDGVLATVVARHYGLGVALASLLPHGIPEALAWILAGACSLLLSRNLRKIFFTGQQRTLGSPDETEEASTSREHRPETFATRLARLLAHPYCRLVIAAALLIVLAGFIEASFTPWLFHLVT
jgi:uncharacterized membrane protein SpoIIM required for sporulation